MSIGKRIVWAIVAMLLLCGCGTAPVEIPETTPAATEAATVSTTVAPTTAETEPTETQLPTVAETEPEEILQIPEAQRIREDFTVFLNRADISYPMGDGDVLSGNTIYENQRLEIESDTPFASLYLVWDNMPGEYTLFYDGGSVSCGKEDFLHEYVVLPEPVTYLEFVFRDGVTPRLCDLFGYTQGSAPEEVQIWQPPCEEADILVFPTHADDDTLFFGALIAYYCIEQELKVQTAFMVQHSSVLPERKHERLNGLWAMGVRYYPILGTAPDSPTHDFQEAMNTYAHSEILQWQVTQIRRFRPLVILGHDLEGEYGNGGHKVNAYYLTQAIHAAKDPMEFPDSAKKYGTWETPKLYLHLYPEHSWSFDVETPMTGDPQGRTPLEVAQYAVDFHVSQKAGIWTVRDGLRNPTLDCRAFGLYHTLVGFDTTADVMENIIPHYWRSRH